MSSRRTVNRKPKKNKTVRQSWGYCEMEGKDLIDNVLYTLEDFPKELFIRNMEELCNLEHGQLVFFPKFPELGVYRFHHTNTIDFYGDPYSLGRCSVLAPLRKFYFPMVKIPNGLIDYDSTWNDYETSEVFESPSGYSWFINSESMPPHPQFNKELYNKIIAEENV